MPPSAQETATRPYVLVVLGHPDPESYCAALADAYVAGLDTERYDVEVLRLGELDLDPVLRFGYRERMPDNPVIARSQDLIVRADHIVLVFPVWWAQMPSLLSGWLGRVLTPGLAYSMQGLRTTRLLRGRTATLVVTSMAPTFLREGAAPLARLTKHHILGFCGITTTQVLTHGWLTTPRDTQAKRERFLAKVGRAAARLDVRATAPRPGSVDTATTVDTEETVDTERRERP